jgi:hypothetical protein
LPKTEPCNFKLYLTNWRWISQTSFILFSAKQLNFVLQCFFILLNLLFCQCCCHLF